MVKRGMPSDSTNTCANCRHHRVEMRPKVLDSAFDTVVAFADHDEKVYLCAAPSGSLAGQAIGAVPVLCEAHEPQRKTLSALDDLLAKAEARLSKRSEGDDR